MKTCKHTIPATLGTPRAIGTAEERKEIDRRLRTKEGQRALDDACRRYFKERGL